MPRKPKSPSGARGRISSGPAPDDGLIPRTIEFIRALLPAWRDDPNRPTGVSEKSLNSSLCDFLDHRARTDHVMVRFKHEAPQTSSRTVDIGVHGTADETVIDAQLYSIYEPFMVIEAKRLPAPTKEREREYVSGTSKANGTPTGGIQRFKLGLHGARVNVAVIVGYIEEQSTQHWHQTINQWISDLGAKPSSDGCQWDQSDSLQQLDLQDEKGTSRTESTHQRMGHCLTPSIRICHLWVVMHSSTFTPDSATLSAAGS